MFVDACKNGLYWGKQDEIIEFTKNTWDERAKKFYSQRNLYILGALLAFQVCIWFIMMQLNSIIKNKDKLSNLIINKNDSKFNNDYEKLKLDIQTLQKQYDSAWEEYSKKGQIKSNDLEKKEL